MIVNHNCINSQINQLIANYKQISRQNIILIINHKSINGQKLDECPSQLYNYTNKYIINQTV